MRTEIYRWKLQVIPVPVLVPFQLDGLLQLIDTFAILDSSSDANCKVFEPVAEVDERSCFGPGIPVTLYDGCQNPAVPTPRSN